MSNYCKVLFILFLFLLPIASLSSCASRPNVTVTDGVTIADSQPDNNDEQNSDESSSTSTQTNQSAIVEKNAEIITNSSGLTIEKTLQASNAIVTICASVDVDDIHTVGSYSYTLESITDSFREQLFTSVFGENASKVEYDKLNDLWILKNSDSVGDYYSFDIYTPLSGETISGEKSFMLLNQTPNLYPFEDNLLDTVTKSTAKLSPEEAISKCNKILTDIGLEQYYEDYILAYGTDGRHPYYKITYKMYQDNMPVTAYNDIFFLVDDDGIQEICRSIFSASNPTLDNQIITPQAAVDDLSNNISQVSLSSDAITVSKISLEYIVVKNLADEPIIVPAWRFLIGATDDQINQNRSLILAVNAISGELIQGERGTTF